MSSSSSPIPEPDVRQCVRIGGEIEGIGRDVRGVFAFGDVVDIKSGPRAGDIVLDVRRLAAKLIWLDDKALDIRRNGNSSDEINHNRQCD